MPIRRMMKVPSGKHETEISPNVSFEGRLTVVVNGKKLSTTYEILGFVSPSRDLTESFWLKVRLIQPKKKKPIIDLTLPVPITDMLEVPPDAQADDAERSIK